MSTKSNYPSGKVLLVPTAVIAALVMTGSLGVSTIAAAQMANTPIQDNIGSSISQPNIAANASDYFVLQSQQDLINAVKTGQVEEIFARIEQTAREIKMASIKDYNIVTRSDENNNNTIRVRIYDPSVQNEPAPLLIYLYGRAGEERNLDFSDPGLRMLANSTGFIVATMDYRFAPFSASLDDVLATVRWIHQNSEQLGVDSQRIALGGVSRGANLALSTALLLRDSVNVEEKNLVRVLYLLSGYYSPDLLESKSAKMFGNGTDLITSKDIEMIFEQIYQNTSSDYANPLAFPLLSKNLTGLPPVYITASGIDPIKDESIQLAARLQEDEQEHYFVEWPGVGHSTGSFIFIPVIPETQPYLDSLAVYLREVLTDNDEKGSGSK